MKSFFKNLSYNIWGWGACLQLTVMWLNSFELKWEGMIINGTFAIFSLTLWWLDLRRMHYRKLVEAIDSAIREAS